MRATGCGSQGQIAT